MIDFSKFKKEDEYFLVNEHDPDLKTFKVKLPSLVEWYAQFLGYTPTWEEAVMLVDGHDRPIEDQYFRVTPMPEKLKNIEGYIKRSRQTKKNAPIKVDDYYDELDKNRSFYKDEITYIQKDIKRRYHGYWFMNEGQPTYIDGWHYFYLHYVDIQSDQKNGLPEYRDVDRRLFLFKRYCYTTTEAWYPYKVTFRKNGQIRESYFSTIHAAKAFAHDKVAAIVEGGDDHAGFIKDFGRRTCYGYAHPKRRRRGATSSCVVAGYLITTESKDRNFGMQSLNDEKARDDVYRSKLVRPWQKFPFWHKPVQNGSSAPADGIRFEYPPDRTSMGVTTKTDSHNGFIEYRSASERAFDGQRLHVALRDEGGKVENYTYDINEWWSITKKCLAQGANIHGFGMIPSTVGEMDSGGGQNYQRLLLNSKWEERDANGFTLTGMLVYMEAAFDGLDGWIDKYGRSIIEDPIKPIYNNQGKLVTEGAKTYLLNTRRAKEEKGDRQGLLDEMRDNPFTLREATTKGTKDSGFNIAILSKRRQELAYKLVGITRRVNLAWKNDVFGGEVLIEDDPQGKWIISRQPDKEKSNKKYFDHEAEHYAPETTFCNKFIVGADPFAFNEQDAQGRTKSDGAIAVFYNRDTSVDDDDKPKSEWVSNKFVCTYSNRAEDKDIYCEDVLKTCILYGCFVFPEMNVPVISEKLKEWGFGGYLLYDRDEYGVPRIMAGRKSTTPVKEDIFAETMTYIQNYGAYENHVEIIEQWLDINDPSEMTKYDLFTAAGYCFLGRVNKYPKELASGSEITKFAQGEFFEEF